MRIKNKHLLAIYSLDKVPRKVKKSYLGERLRRRTLREMLDETVLGNPIRTMYERREATPHGLFCPNCGYHGYVGNGNRTGYPDHWESFSCLKCKRTVGYIDNSPFIHALECAEYGYNPNF